MATAIVLAVGAARGAVRLGPGVGATGSTERSTRIGGHPNFNGIWQAQNTAYCKS